ncbi:MAG TPA: amidohydrolase family protein, partial [Ferruginibacter sp.]|nr:amidohydrolase family protein [Ferruginibacter sp.]
MPHVLRYFILMGAILGTGCKFRQKVDLIVHHARIYTVDAGFTIREAMAVQDGKILAVGSNDDILKAYEAGEELNGNGQTILPGLIDAHCHFTGYATDLWKCALFGTKSFDEVLERLSAYAPHAPMYWLYGRGWDQNDWLVKQFPDKAKLDSLYPNRPVYLKRIDGHAALANQKALDIAGINNQTTIAGGTVEQKNGRLTGILIDNAMNLLEKHIPPISDSLAATYFLQAQKECFAYGLTGVHDCGVTEAIVDLVKKEQDAGRLQMKIYALLTDIPEYYDRWINKGPLKTALLHVGGFKWYADGALGSRGPCLIRDYHDQPGWRGFLLSDTSYFLNLARKL